MNGILLSGTHLATRPVMHRTAGQVAVLALAFIAFLFQGSHAPATTADSRALQTDTSVPAPISQPPVRITRELIRVPAQRAVAAPRQPRQLVQRRAARDKPRRGDDSAASWTRRLLIGDGQYRPEPFPRLTR